MRFAVVTGVLAALAGGLMVAPVWADEDAEPTLDAEVKDAPAPEAPAKPPRTDAFTLVGTLSSAKDSYAFFDGTDQEYKQVYHVGEKVGGYTVASIGFDHVKLKNANGEVTLALQMQLRRESEGEWKLLPLTEAFTPRVVPPAPVAAAPSGPPPPSSGSRSSGSSTSSRNSTPAPAGLASGLPPEIMDRISKKSGGLSESDLERIKMIKAMRDAGDSKPSKKFDKILRKSE